MGPGSHTGSDIIQTPPLTDRHLKNHYLALRVVIISSNEEELRLIDLLEPVFDGCSSGVFPSKVNIGFINK